MDLFVLKFQKSDIKFIISDPKQKTIITSF